MGKRRKRCGDEEEEKKKKEIVVVVLMKSIKNNSHRNGDPDFLSHVQKEGGQINFQISCVLIYTYMLQNI